MDAPNLTISCTILSPFSSRYLRLSQDLLHRVFSFIPQMDGNTEARIESIKTDLSQTYDMLHSHPGDWEQYLPFARGVMSVLDDIGFMNDRSRHQEQVWIIECLQRLAYQQPDEGGVRDIARWSQNQWLKVLEGNPENFEALRGERKLCVH